jgi:prepilin-type N-terminal cleavage/methylation domain-containing protein
MAHLIKKYKYGFTLIELLVVVAIISLLSSIVFASLNTARAKARDARRLSDARQIQLAIQLYYDKTGGMPINRDIGVSYPDSQPDFLKELVDEGFLATRPRDVLSPTMQYFYYDYGSADSRGAVIKAQLETIKNHPSSCQVSDWQFWVCNPY